MRKGLALALLGIVAAMTIGALSLQAADTIKIGFIPSITGAAAAEGALQLKAIKLAAKQINAAGGVNGKQIELVIADNQSSNPGALAALQKVVEQDKVLAMVGVIKSTQILAMSETIQKYGIPMMIGGTLANLTKRGNPWLFRFRPDDSVTSAAMVKYLKEDTKFTKIGILHDSDAFGTGGADLVEASLKRAGLQMVKRERYTTKDKDFTAQLLSLKNAGAQVMILYATNDNDAAVVVRQYRQLGSPYFYLSTSASQMKDFLDLARDAAEGIVCLADYIPGQSAVTKKYEADYRNEYHEDFDATEAWTYDGLNVLVNAIRKAGEDRAKIRAAILATQGYQGVLGTYNFTPQGDGLHQVSVIQIEKGEKRKLVKVVNVPAE